MKRRTKVLLPVDDDPTHVVTVHHETENHHNLSKSNCRIAQHHLTLKLTFLFFADHAAKDLH